MSKSLVLKAIELMDDVEDSNSVDQQPRRSGDGASGETSTKRRRKPEKEVAKSLPTNKWGLKKEKLRLEKDRKERRDKMRVKCTGIETKSKKSSVEQLRERQSVDETEYNVSLLKKMSGLKMRSHVTRELLASLGCDNGKNGRKKAVEKTESTSVFTESDFEKFVKEYVV